jgi:hypothetical protein
MEWNKKKQRIRKQTKQKSKEKEKNVLKRNNFD